MQVPTIVPPHTRLPRWLLVTVTTLAALAFLVAAAISAHDDGGSPTREGNQVRHVQPVDHELIRTLT